MKEFITNISNFLFPGVSSNVGMWLTIGFFVAFVVVGIVLCIVLIKKNKKEDAISENTNQVLDENNSQAEVAIEEQEEQPKEEVEKEEANNKPAAEPEKEEAKTSSKKATKTKEETKESSEQKPQATKKEKTEQVEEQPKISKKKTTKATVKKEEPAKAEKQVESNEEEAKADEPKVRAQKYMVIYDKEKKDWIIKKTGALKASKRCKTKKEAMEFVEKYAENQDLNISVKKKDGKFQKKY